MIKKAGAALRLKVMEGVQVWQLSSEGRSLAKQVMTEGPLPGKTELDALHIGIAVVNGMDYLLTWNCTHIANAAIRHMIEAVCRSMGCEPPVICTPEELMEE